MVHFKRSLEDIENKYLHLDDPLLANKNSLFLMRKIMNDIAKDLMCIKNLKDIEGNCSCDKISIDFKNFDDKPSDTNIVAEGKIKNHLLEEMKYSFIQIGNPGDLVGGGVVCMIRIWDPWMDVLRARIFNEICT